MRSRALAAEGAQLQLHLLRARLRVSSRCWRVRPGTLFVKELQRWRRGQQLVTYCWKHAQQQEQQQQRPQQKQECVDSASSTDVSDGDGEDDKPVRLSSGLHWTVLVSCLLILALTIGLAW